MPDRSPHSPGLSPPGKSLSSRVLVGNRPVDGCRVLGLSADRLVLSVPVPLVLSFPRPFTPGQSLLVVLSNATTLYHLTVRLEVARVQSYGTGPLRVEGRLSSALSPEDLTLLSG